MNRHYSPLIPIIAQEYLFHSWRQPDFFHFVVRALRVLIIESSHNETSIDPVENFFSGSSTTRKVPARGSVLAEKVNVLE